ncbi:MAG: phosphoglycolate phosphatase [Alphaproteobacteria bacterium]|nr:phosphoglycolate phosphatase [Alphaproteobacteria bacterium]
MRSAIVFDLDGTLVDTAPDLTSALNAVLASAGRATVDPAGVRTLVGAGARGLLTRGFATTGRALTPSEVEGWVPQFLSFYREHLADGSRPYPGVTSGLARFRGLGIRMAVCTNKPVELARDLLALLDLKKYFDTVLGGDSRAYRKPDPRHLTDTLAEIGASTKEALMIGDSVADIGAARGAGVPIVIANYGYGAIEAAALGGDATIGSFAELEQIVDELS